MSDTAIRAENLSKWYRLGQISLRNNTFGDAFSNTLRRIRTGKPNAKPQKSTSGDDFIWSLKDVSFEIKKGEAVGIIGPNGAGKSTLLKILSRITEPTSGYADVYGRIGALLEVGTGFHLELTGRENLFLNGAILGMSRHEILRKYDEIVDFAGVEKFMDTPVKRYSSGMRLRLGFAVAAYLEPEILVIDEVLAVGDAEFQQRCLTKMEDVTKQGRTVLFVSHNLDAVTTLTERTILLKQGRVEEVGPSQAIVMKYLRTLDKSATAQGWMTFNKQSTDEPQADVDLMWMRTANEHGEQTAVFTEGETITVTVGLVIHKELGSFQMGFFVKNLAHRDTLFTVPSPLITENLRPGEYTLQFEMNPNNLKSGDYYIIVKHFADRIMTRHEGLPLKIVAGQGGTDDVHQLAWVLGSFRFDYKFSPLEPVKERVTNLYVQAGEEVSTQNK